MAGVAQQKACTTRLAAKEPRFVSEDERGVLMHSRCVLVSLCPSDGRHGHRISAQGAVAFSSDWATGPFRICRGMRFDAEEGESGGGIGALR